MSEIMAVICWEEPPPKSHAPSRRDWSAVIAELRANPGEWAVILAVPKSQERLARDLRAQISLGIPKVFGPRGSFEVASRRVGDETRLYARAVVAP